MKQSGTSPLLTNDQGTRYVGIKHPDGTESILVFAAEGSSGPAGSPGELATVQWPIAEADTDIALLGAPTTVVVGSIFRIDEEYMVVTDISNVDNPKVTRGRYGTSTATHAAGAQVEIWPPSAGKR